MDTSYQTFLFRLPLETILPPELFSFTIEENALLLKIGLDVILYNKEHPSFPVGWKDEIDNRHKKILEEKNNQIYLLEKELTTSSQHQEKTFQFILKEKEQIIDFYRENSLRFEKTFEEFKKIHSQQKDEIVSLQSTLNEKIKEDAIKGEELFKKVFDQLEQKNKPLVSTISVGNEGELFFQQIANDTFRDFPEYESLRVSEQNHVGDIHLFFREFNVLCDTKFHKNKICKNHRDQIKNDLQRNTKFKFAWLISIETSINKYNQAPFIFESFLDEYGNKLYICYINHFANHQNKQELLRSVWYASKTLFQDVIESQNDNNELSQLKIFKENTTKTVEQMVKISKEMNDQIKMLQKTKDVLDNTIKSLCTQHVILTIQDELKDVVEVWWKKNIKLNPNNILSETTKPSSLTSNKLFQKFKKENISVSLTLTDFKNIIRLFVDPNNILSLSKNNFEIKNISFL